MYSIYIYLFLLFSCSETKTIQELTEEQLFDEGLFKDIEGYFS